MSCFSGLPRSATAIAAEDSVLLFFNQDTAIQLLRASPRFALGVIQTLCDRIRGSNERIARLEAGGAVAAAPPAPASAQPTPARPSASASAVAIAAATARPTTAAPASGAREIPAGAFDRQLYWAKVVTCPVSQVRFSALNVRPEATKLKARESDLREVYDGPNPLWYLAYVCPDCLYAAYPDDLPTLTSTEIARLASGSAARREMAAGADLAGERSVEAAFVAYRLAVDCYLQRPPNPQRLGGLYQRLAWLAREMKDEEAERANLAEALAQYSAALEKQRPTEPLAELMLIYTVGELSLRLSKPAEAVRFFAQASQHPEFRKQPEIQRLCRDRWTAARDLARPRA
jgi:hypothetical protein